MGSCCKCSTTSNFVEIRNLTVGIACTKYAEVTPLKSVHIVQGSCEYFSILIVTLNVTVILSKVNSKTLTLPNHQCESLGVRYI